MADAATRQGTPLLRLLTAPVRVLPDFVIIGAQRCGTTSLYHTLLRHPRVGAATTKEVHFFDNNHDRGALWYRAHLPTVFDRWRNQRGGSPYRTGEASPYYLFHPLAPGRLKAMVPGAKLIVILRNPVERAYSHYHHSVRKGYESLSFEQALAVEEDRLAGEYERITSDPRYVSIPHLRWSYVSRGLYMDQLQAWLCHFAREQLLVLHLADVVRDPKRSWDRVFRFLGIDPFEIGTSERRSIGAYDAIEPATRRMLQERFRPHNARLYGWLGEDLGWDA